MNMKLLLCMVCHDQTNSFFSYDKTKLFRFAEFYPNEFSAVELIALEHQLDNYILDVRSNNQLFEIMRVSGLAKKIGSIEEVLCISITILTRKADTIFIRCNY